ncbi:MAG: SGNH/GDSL hydrolase family protein, partial [Bacillota bacterium]|jgi:hypothetical protein
MGGSITDSRGRSRWPEPVIAWFVKSFPKARIAVENAAIGATCSDQAVFRVKRDLIDRNCDLVFVEYAVNDMGIPAKTRSRAREGLLRKLLAGGTRDVVLVYTFAQDMYSDMVNNRVPETVAEFERLGEHYGLGSVWMGLHAMREVMAGQMRWEEWLPDGLHPEHRGSLSYAQSVIAFLNHELIVSPPDTDAADEYVMPEPLNPRNWEHTYNLSFDFSGRGLSLSFDFGKASADFRYRLNQGEWIDYRFDRPECRGTNLRLGLIGVIK